jgi:hypothetical protein
LLSPPWFIVIGGGRRLILRASKLSADGLGNPPNAGIEGLAAERSVVVGRTKSLPFIVFRHSDVSSSGSIGQKATKKRRAEVGKLHYRIMA